MCIAKYVCICMSKYVLCVLMHICTHAWEYTPVSEACCNCSFKAGRRQPEIWGDETLVISQPVLICLSTQSNGHLRIASLDAGEFSKHLLVSSLRLPYCPSMLEAGLCASGQIWARRVLSESSFLHMVPVGERGAALESMLMERSCGVWWNDGLPGEISTASALGCD